MINLQAIIVIIVALFFSATMSYSGVITSLSLIEKDGVTTNNYPLTFGHVFKQGDINVGILVKYNGTPLTTQFDKKTSWPDGSVKIGVISIVIPQVVANGTGTLTIETASLNNVSGAMDKTSIIATDIGSIVTLTNLSGSGYSGAGSASLRDQINDGNLNYWLQGPVCTEVLESQQINDSLNAAWEARFYPGTSFGIRISNSVENVSILNRGNVAYNLSIEQGNTTPSTVYTKLGFNHLHGSRWRKIFWLGNEPPETELKYDLDYLKTTGAIVNYDSSLIVPETTLSSEFSAWNVSARDIDGNGLINKYFPTTGGRREIGVLPRWAAMYLLTMDNRMKELVIGHAEIAGHVPRVHWRETDSQKINYKGVVTVDDRPTYDLIADTGGGIPAAIGSLDKGGWTPDRAHMGSFSYLAYLITGDYWFQRETAYWGSYVIAYDEYGRSGGTGNPAYGNIYDQIRGVAWSLRSLSDAAFVTMDTDSVEKNYFISKLNNNLTWFCNHNQQGSHGVHALRSTREYDDPATDSPWNYSIGPWQHDFFVLIMRHIVNQKTDLTEKAEYLLNYLGYFTAGRFTNHPTFNKWDGAGYYFPLSEKGGTSFYNDGDWATYWANVLEMDQYNSSGQGLPNSSYTRYDYADSYLAIAVSAIAGLSSVENAYEAYSFARGELTTAKLADNPTWAIIPMAESTQPSSGKRYHYRSIEKRK